VVADPAPEAAGKGLHVAIASVEASVDMDLDNGADKASDEEWWTTVTSTLPNLDGVMSPS
jgi:hypothetical protein